MIFRFNGQHRVGWRALTDNGYPRNCNNQGANRRHGGCCRNCRARPNRSHAASLPTRAGRRIQAESIALAGRRTSPRGTPTRVRSEEPGRSAAIVALGTGRRFKASMHRSACRFAPVGGRLPTPGTSVNKASGEGGHGQCVRAMPLAFNRYGTSMHRRSSAVSCSL